ncbi:MAG: hypothetical protein AAF298_11045 [Cyanobacteria bacterium P01_A01_bin.40]
MMDIKDVFAVINTEKAGAMCLSKGGWEGWLQCELWWHLSIEKKLEVEREVSYPGSSKRCDLVLRNSNPELWIELKAYGVFREGDADRFLNAIATDVLKIEDLPSTANGLVLVVLPNAIAESFHSAINRRGWHGFKSAQGKYATIFHMSL